MTDLQFDEDKYGSSFQSRSILGEARSPAMIRFILKTGLIKDEKKAGYFLIALSLVFFALTAYISYALILNKGGSSVKLTPQQIQQRQKFQERVRAGLPPLRPTPAER